MSKGTFKIGSWMFKQGAQKNLPYTYTYQEISYMQLVLKTLGFTQKIIFKYKLDYSKIYVKSQMNQGTQEHSEEGRIN